MHELFKKVKDPNHDPKDFDCMCYGCIQVLDKLAEEMAHKIKKEHQMTEQENGNE